MFRKMIFLLIMSLLAVPTFAQDTVVVPDVTGMTVPQAAAILNLVGLNLGSETAVEPQAGQDINTILAMSVEAGTELPRGSAVDVSVILAPNMRLIYDDNDITVLNLAESNLSLEGIRFAATNDANIGYQPSQLTGFIDFDDCVQLWSVTRNQPKEVAGCDTLIWRTSTNTANHFWTQSNGVETFSVTENGIERAVCPAALPNTQDSPVTCDVYVSSGGSATGADVTPFIYLAYNANAVTIVNTTQDQWMLTNQTTFVNNNPNLTNPGTTLIFGDANLFTPENTVGVGDITRLAPQQCIMFSIGGADVTDAPQPCFLIGEVGIDPNFPFWRTEFQIRSSTLETEVTCPAATSDELIICIAPR